MDLATLAAAFLFAVLPALFWLSIYYHKDYRDPEPKMVVFKTFVAGAAMALPFLAIRFGLERFPQLSAVLQGALSVVVFAAMEEMAKLMASIFIVTRHRIDFNQVIDGVVYAVTAALGFAFVENMIYFAEFLKINTSPEAILYSVAFRSMGTMLAHTLFSATAGLIWAYAYFSKQITPFEQKKLLAFEVRDLINHEILTLHIIRNNVLKAAPSRRGGHEKKILVMEGLFLATLLHVIFNLTTSAGIFGKNLTFLVVPGIIFGFFTVSYWYTKKLNTRILKVV